MQYQLTETRKKGKVLSEVPTRERHVPGREMSVASCVKAEICVGNVNAVVKVGRRVARHEAKSQAECFDTLLPTFTSVK